MELILDVATHALSSALDDMSVDGTFDWTQKRYLVGFHYRLALQMPGLVENHQLASTHRLYSKMALGLVAAFPMIAQDIRTATKRHLEQRKAMILSASNTFLKHSESAECECGRGLWHKPSLYEDCTCCGDLYAKMVVMSWVNADIEAALRELA